MIFISEIGLNHNGNFDLCYELIKQSKNSGANIVKFQLGWKSKSNEINFLDKKRIIQLINWAKYFEIDIMFSVFHDDALRMLKPFLNKNSRIKIASRTVIDNPILVRKIIKMNLETIISLGMWNKKTLPFLKKKKIKYLWCKSTYPNSINDLKKFPKVFNNKLFDGFSDHTIGIETALIAISRGANIIEKHFTLDKSNTTIRDHTLSSTPEEFQNLVEIGNDINRKIKSGI